MGRPSVRSDVAFSDSFYYFALVSPRDPAHAAALRVGLAGRRTVTTAWVLTEVADGLATRGGRAIATGLIRKLRVDPLVEILPPSPRLFDRGLDLYAARPDKGWSLTDCISFVVMRDRGLSEALTGDHHFEQAGFLAVLRV